MKRSFFVASGMLALSLSLCAETAAAKDREIVIKPPSVYVGTDSSGLVIGSDDIVTTLTNACRPEIRTCDVPCDSATLGEPAKNATKRVCEVLYQCKGASQTKSLIVGEHTAIQLRCP